MVTQTLLHVFALHVPPVAALERQLTLFLSVPLYWIFVPCHMGAVSVSRAARLAE